MANGRRPRRVGFQQNTALDALERALGIAQGIGSTISQNRAQKAKAELDRQKAQLDRQKFALEQQKFQAKQVKEMRDSRSNYANSFIERIDGEIGNTRNKEKLISLKNQLEKNLGYFINRTNPEVQDLYNATLNKIENFNTLGDLYSGFGTSVNNLIENLNKEIEDYRINQNVMSDAERKQHLDKIMPYQKEFYAILNELNSDNHKDAYNTDKELKAKVNLLDGQIGFAITEFMSENNMITDAELDNYTLAYLTKDPKYLQVSDDILTTNIQEQMKAQSTIFNKLTTQIPEKEKEIDEIVFGENVIPLRPTSDNFDENFKTIYAEYLSKGKNNFLNQFIDNSVDLSEEEAKRQYKNQYFKKYEAVEDLKAQRNAANNKYRDVNPEGVGLDENLSITQGPLPAELVSEIDGIVKDKFKNTMFKNIKFNDMRDLYNNIVNMYENAGESEKKQIRIQFNRIVNTINQELGNNERLNKTKRNTINKIYPNIKPLK